jgi:hypothetical protein
MKLLTLLTVLIAFDAAITLYALKRGGYEANPLLRPLIDQFGAVPTLLVTHAGAIAGFYLWPPGEGWVLGMTIFFAAVGAWNVYQVSKTK